MSIKATSRWASEFHAYGINLLAGLDQSALPGKRYGLIGSQPIAARRAHPTSGMPPYRYEAEQAFSAEASEARGTPTNRIILGRTLPGHAVSRERRQKMQ